MKDSQIRPCAFPKCDNGAGDPRLTMNGICDGCRLRYRRLLDWIVQDYIDLAKRMPKPQAPVKSETRTQVTSYGHEREWASDALRKIATLFRDAESYVREDAGERVVLKSKRERVAVREAFEYLTAGTVVGDVDSLHTVRFDRLCRMQMSGDMADDMASLHRRIRSLTGRSIVSERLDYVCPRCAVPRSIVRWPGGGKDYMQCDSCGEVIEEKYYGLHALIALQNMYDDMFEAYDTLKKSQ